MTSPAGTIATGGAGTGVPLTFACGLYDRMQALYTGEVRPEGIALDFHAIEAPRVIFDRMAGERAFDLAEMSASEFIAHAAGGDSPFVALPVFPSRAFRHGFISVNRRAVREPRDLAGKRIGVPLYTMTAAVWIRALLTHDFGVDLSGVTWVQGSINGSGAHGEPTVLPMARPVAVEVNRSGRSLSQLLDAGEIDAIVGTTLPESRRTNPDVQRLFPDHVAVEKDYFRRTGIFPVMHVVAMRREAHASHPFAAQSLYEAFCASRDIAAARMRNLAALRYMLPWLPAALDEIDAVFGGDPWPYGIERNRPTLQALVEHLAEQGVIERPLPLERLFVPVDESRHA